MKYIVFVILNYNTPIETINCIHSIDKLDQEDFAIKCIIVDNHSSDNSMRIFQEELAEITTVEYVEMPENVGFSRANNAGYEYAVEKYDPEFIILMNSDILVYQKNFIKKITELYQKERFYVLGPDIYVPKLFWHQSPTIRKRRLTLDALEDELDNLNKQLKIINADKIKGKKTVKGYSKWARIRKNIVRNIYCLIFGKGYRKTGYNVHLHGAALVFSKCYTQAHPKKCFDPETFLYSEEDILRYQCMKRSEKMLYSPEIKVRHMESVATYKKWGTRNNIDLRLMVAKHKIDSLQTLINLVKEDSNHNELHL